LALKYLSSYDENGTPELRIEQPDGTSPSWLSPHSPELAILKSPIELPV